MLAGVMAELKASDKSLALVAGFDEQELLTLLRQDAAEVAEDDDEVEPSAELQLKWQTELGQVWELPSRANPGRSHRLMCGNSELEADIEKLRAGTRWLLMITDPPYGVNYDPTWRDDINRGTTKLTGKVENDHRADWTKVYKLSGADVGYVWHGGLHAGLVQLNLEEAGFKIRTQIIWHKSNLVLSRGNYHWQHEPCWYAVKEGAKSGWAGDRTQSTTWDIPNLNPRGGGGKGDDTPVGHGTQKPVECFRRPLRNHYAPGVVAFDPFHGSGSMLVACEREARICHAMELSPIYLAMQLERAVTRLGLEPRKL